MKSLAAVRAHSCAPLHLPLLLAMLCVGCVPLEQLPPGAIPAGVIASTTTVVAFPDLDAGGTSLTTHHFSLKGYSESELHGISESAEYLYNKIGNDTGLYNFLASGTYTLIVYKDREEYLAKTHQPSWSRAIALGSSLYFYPGADLEAALAHEMSHLIFNAYMGPRAASLKWLNEGIAMAEELTRMTDSDRTSYFASRRTQLRQSRMSFSQMTFFVTNTEEKRREDAWYQQVESIVSYLMSQGSPLAFAQMMSELRSGADLDRAVSDAYPGRFRSLNDLEAAWKYTL